MNDQVLNVEIVTPKWFKQRVYLGMKLITFGAWLIGYKNVYYYDTEDFNETR